MSLFIFFVPQTAARSKTTTWPSYLYHNSGRIVLLNSTGAHHQLSASLLRCRGAPQLLQGFTLHVLPQPTPRRYQTQTDCAHITPDPVFVRVNSYFLADYNSFSSGMPRSTACCDRSQNVDSLNFCACRIMYSQLFFENLHTQLRHFCTHASGDFFFPLNEYIYD